MSAEFEKPKYLKHQKIIPGIVGTNLTKSNCPDHGEGVYFERVEGDLFQCANISHHEIARLNLSNKPRKNH